MPKWGYSRGDYSFDNDKRIIAKGLSSIKYMGDKVADALYFVSKSGEYRRFVDVLSGIDKSKCADARQIDILIKLDFFSEYGNQRELLAINDLYTNKFNRGSAKQIKKATLEGSPLDGIVKKYSIGTTKSGSSAKSYTIVDIESILRESEDAVKELHMEDLSDTIKVKNFEELMGYAGYVSGKNSDRRKLYVLDVYQLVRHSDNKQFGYSVITKSIGSGKEARFTVVNRLYDRDPIKKGDIIYCKSFERNGQYYKLTDYAKIF